MTEDQRIAILAAADAVDAATGNLRKLVLAVQTTKDTDPVQPPAPSINTRKGLCYVSKDERIIPALDAVNAHTYREWRTMNFTRTPGTFVTETHRKLIRQGRRVIFCFAAAPTTESSVTSAKLTEWGNSIADQLKALSLEGPGEVVAEIGNEPNLRTYWQSSDSDAWAGFEQWYKVVQNPIGKIIRARLGAGTKVRLIGAGLSENEGWFDYILRSKLVDMTVYDGMAFHPYAYTKEDVLNKTLDACGSMRRAGFDPTKDLYLTEVAVLPGWTANDVPSVATERDAMQAIIPLVAAACYFPGDIHTDKRFNTIRLLGENITPLTAYGEMYRAL